MLLLWFQTIKLDCNTTMVTATFRQEAGIGSEDAESPEPETREVTYNINSVAVVQPSG